MLETLTFDLVVGSPYQQLYKLLEQVGAIHNKLLRHAAWAFCNDSCLTTLPLLMDTRDVALASIFFASNFRKEPVGDVSGLPWWQALNGKEDLIVKAIDVMSNFYTENPLRKQDNPYEGSPSFSFENTRQRSDGSSANLTPQTEHNTQSPRAEANGTDVATSGSKYGDSMVVEETVSTVPGDSDALLKAAANVPETHPVTNGDEATHGNGLVTLQPKKREVESQEAEARVAKRPRVSEETDDADEGEVPE